MSHVRVHSEGTVPGHAAAHATGAGSVVLELGGDVGVLVLHTPARLHGTEIEIRPDGDDPHGYRPRSLVRERITAAGTSYAAVYPAVPAGRYAVWGDGGVPVGTVVISGGQVACFHWPE